ncbi:dihydropteroate synthase [Actibacterium lipolyticum]|uniref:Dihydropteroate synthase n=1 Tax=Actibacterium lipolyticum TaxID=1524263 RepID=A0A238KKY5_9RHOB|nr:dihydropteroate synthase [Actibacterium lipolyticum]SMX43277.1 Dihydropteroate synthase [Actibacterium lipolyticum]
MKYYYRPILQTDVSPTHQAIRLAGGWTWFAHVEQISRAGTRRIISAAEVPTETLEALSAPRAPIAGLSMDRPRLMGILNVTPDSFSDGGKFNAPDAALTQGRALADAGADMIDVGGESTRPGADDVVAGEEITRTAAAIGALRAAGVTTPISIDTRKAAVAQAALLAGANLINDVAAFTYDLDLAGVAANAGVPVCLMHAQGTPQNMQAAPQYDDVLLDVYDFLEERVAMAEAAGIPRADIVVDPGIGFGKTQAHNIALLQGISLFHGLGCPVLLGASRKRFIGEIGNAPDPADRTPGSIAVALAAAAQGVQFLRVHDMTETRQALSLAEALWNL